MMQTLQPWTRLSEVLGVLLPLFTFSFLASVAIYFVFAVLLPWFANSFNSKAASPRVQVSDSPANPPTEPVGDANLGYLGSFSYIFVTSLFGIVLGMLVKLLGGFTALATGNAPPSSVIGAVGAVIVIIIGVAGSLFTDSDRIAVRRPAGAIGFLISFLVSGFYWQFLKGALET